MAQSLAVYTYATAWQALLKLASDAQLSAGLLVVHHWHHEAVLYLLDIGCTELLECLP